MSLEQAETIVSNIRNTKYSIRDLLIEGTNERKFVLSSLKELENKVWSLLKVGK